MSIPYLSIIIPVHNEQNRLPEAVKKIFSRSWKYAFEVIAVENGSSDYTLNLCAFYADLYPQFRFLSIPGRGKGAAVRAGMLAAGGYWRYQADVDLATPIEWVDAYIAAGQMLNADVVLGVRPERSGARSVMAWSFRQVVKSTIPGIVDSQCGFKLFWQQAAFDLFSQSTLSGMAYDVEILYLAQRYQYKIEQIDIPWVHDPDSRVRLVGDSLQMLRDVLKIPRLHRREMKKLPA